MGGRVTPFQDSLFVVAWTGECPTSRLIKGWPAVVEYINGELGEDAEGNPIFSDPATALSDPDEWEHFQPLPPIEDTRLIYRDSEFVYCVGITIVRVIEADDALR